MQTKLTCKTTLTESHYGPHNPKWSTSQMEVLHELNHTFIFNPKNKESVEVPVYHLFRFAEFFNSFDTPGEAMNILYKYTDHGDKTNDRSSMETTLPSLSDHLRGPGST